MLDLAEVPLIDTTAAKSLAAFVRKLHGLGTIIMLAGARPTIAAVLAKAGMREPNVRLVASAADARTVFGHG